MTLGQTCSWGTPQHHTVTFATNDGMSFNVVSSEEILPILPKMILVARHCYAYYTTPVTTIHFTVGPICVDGLYYLSMLRRARLCHSKSSVRLSVRLSVHLLNASVNKF